MSRRLRPHGLGLFFGAIFLMTIIGQALVGHADYNHLQAAHHDSPLGLWRYVTSSDFGADVLENWQSEYLQFTLYILTTVWLLQRGSPESKELDKAGLESDEEQKVGEHAEERSPLWAKVGGLRTAIYSNSLLMVMTTLWLGSWLAQAIAGRIDYNAQQPDHPEAGVGFLTDLGRSDFWD